MDLVAKLLNLVAPSAMLTVLFLILPPLYPSKLILSFFSSPFPENMDYKVVLITGASSGSGEQIAYQYAKKGARLVLLAWGENSEKNLHEVGETCRELGSPDVLIVPADVSKAEECRGFVEATIEHFGQLDHLVLNAGVTHVCMLEEVVDITRLRQVMDVNFWGYVYLTFFALHLKKTRGRMP